MLLSTLIYKGNEYQIQITYKKIKHMYLRFKNNAFLISANKNHQKNDIENFILKNIDKFLNKERKRTYLNKYSLWGKELTKNEFFCNMEPIEKNYLEILKRETIEKTGEILLKIAPSLKALKIELVPIKFKKLLSRYGSCHTLKKEITINIFLAKVDPLYLEYVLFHEFAHLKQANHSKKFYMVLDVLLHDHKKIQKDLRKIPIFF